MFLSIFTDELGMDLTKALPILKSWGLTHCDLRGRIFGQSFESLTDAQIESVKALLDEHDLKVGCLQSSLAKVHLPDEPRCRAEEEKLEAIIRVADALDCRLVRSFFYWQPPKAETGAVATRPDMLQRVLDHFAPLAERAKEAGLTLAFENCGVTTYEVEAVLDALDVPEWGMAWDVSNTWDSPERRQDEVAYLVRCAQLARCVHVKARSVVPGLGDTMVPWERVLATCSAAGMEGPVSVETHNPDPSLSNEEVSHQVTRAMQRVWPSAAPSDLYSAAKPKPEITVTRSYEDHPVGFVVVGLGMGHNRSRTVTQTPGARLVGVCDLDEERAKRSSEEFEVPYTTDVQPWLEDDEVEVIYVLTPTGRHAEVGLQALKAGKHVLTTKPMEASLDACDRMIREAEKQGLLLAVDFGRRFASDTLTFQNAVQKGHFGDLLSGESNVKILRSDEYFLANGGWRGTRRWDGGGVLSNQNIHHLDELAFVLGIPARVRCTIWTQHHDIEAEDLGIATWEYENGLVINMYATTNYPQPTWYGRTELFGTDGAFVKVSGGPVEKPQTQWYLNGTWGETPPEAIESPWLNAADNMAAAIREGAALVCPGRDGRRSQAILDAMYRSAYEHGGGWVDVEPELD